jgi:hypothetical protein
MINNTIENKSSEKGGASVKFLAVLLVLILVGNAGINYIPIAYEGESFKQDMQTAVVQGMAVPPGIAPADMIKGKLQRAIIANDIPPDAVVQVKPGNNTVLAHVSYSKKVAILPFGIYTYNYKFDHTATPTGFLMKESLAIQ